VMDRILDVFLLLCHGGIHSSSIVDWL